MLFNSVNNGLAGIVGPGFDNKKKSASTVVQRHGVSFRALLDKFEVPAVVDYLSLDIEGAEYEVMRNFPFDSYKIKLLTVERPNAQLKSLLREQGYVFVTSSYNRHGDELWQHSLFPSHMY